VKAAAPIGVLVVEDYGPYRSFVTFLINQNPPFQVIGEAVDGLEAVDKVQELRPDMVLMDIALPKLDGLEAARRIKALSSAPRVIFLSSNSDAQIVEEAFGLGACGFIAKNRATSHLLAALEAAFHRCASVSSCLVQIVDEENARKAVLAFGCCRFLRTL
jgi:DNA-binding NarL/FixJ family response regulator